MEVRSLKCWLWGHLWKDIKSKDQMPRRSCISCGSIDRMERRGNVAVWFPVMGERHKGGTDE